jgi:hypothetical protein
VTTEPVITEPPASPAPVPAPPGPVCVDIADGVVVDKLPSTTLTIVVPASVVAIVVATVVGWHENTVAVLVTTCVPSVSAVVTVDVTKTVEVVVERISAPRFFKR